MIAPLVILKLFFSFFGKKKNLTDCTIKIFAAVVVGGLYSERSLIFCQRFGNLT